MKIKFSGDNAEYLIESLVKALGREKRRVRFLKQRVAQLLPKQGQKEGSKDQASTTDGTMELGELGFKDPWLRSKNELLIELVQILRSHCSETSRFDLDAVETLERILSERRDLIDAIAPPAFRTASVREVISVYNASMARCWAALGGMKNARKDLAGNIDEVLARLRKSKV
jgi:hypothetical protein